MRRNDCILFFFSGLPIRTVLHRTGVTSVAGVRGWGEDEQGALVGPKVKLKLESGLAIFLL